MVMPLLIWGVVLHFVLAALLALDDGLRRLKRLHQIPCHRCQYYSDSPYLKCPLHPRDACSEAVLQCPDFEARTFGLDKRSPRRSESLDARHRIPTPNSINPIPPSPTRRGEPPFTLQNRG